MDSYQAIYDAVRSRISGGDIGSAVENAIRDASISDYARMAQNSVEYACNQFTQPSVLYRPKLSIDGNQWVALYGDNLQDGVAGFGNTPAKAMSDLDKNWFNYDISKLKQK